MTISEEAFKDALQRVEIILRDLMDVECIQGPVSSSQPKLDVTFSGNFMQSEEKESDKISTSNLGPKLSRELSLSENNIQPPGSPRVRLPDDPHAVPVLEPITGMASSETHGQPQESTRDKSTRWNRQVSVMAERSRHLAQSAQDLDDEDFRIRFQMHEFFRSIHDETFSHRNSRRRSICTTNTAPLVVVRPSRLSKPFVFESWAAMAIVMIVADGFRIPLLALPGDVLQLFDVLLLTFWLVSIPVIWTMRRGQTRTTQWARCFWLEIVFAASTACILVPNAFAFATLLRGLPLLRISYIASFWDILSSRHARPWIQRCSREVRFVLNLLLALMTGALLLHVLTCTWYAVGNHADGWVQDQGVERLPPIEQYRIAAEWALSRLPPSRLPENMLLKTQQERWMAVAATTVAMVFGSIFTSIVTNDMSDIRRFHSAQRKSENELLKYLRAYPVSWDLEAELKAYLGRSRSLIQPPRKEEMAPLLPNFLYRELCKEALSPVIVNHDFLNGLRFRYPAFHSSLCVECLSDWHIATEEILFSAGPRCHSMLFIARGQVTYRKSISEVVSSPINIRNDLLSKDLNVSKAVIPLQRFGSSVEENLGFGDWICEQCLWTEWNFLGTAASKPGATLLCLGDENLLKYAGLHKEVMAELLTYARLFVENLNDVADDDLTDLPMSLEDAKSWT